MAITSEKLFEIYQRCKLVGPSDPPWVQEPAQKMIEVVGELAALTPATTVDLPQSG
jgi:hypothetical protein